MIWRDQCTLCGRGLFDQRIGKTHLLADDGAGNLQALRGNGECECGRHVVFPIQE